MAAMTASAMATSRGAADEHATQAEPEEAGFDLTKYVRPACSPHFTHCSMYTDALLRVSKVSGATMPTLLTVKPPSWPQMVILQLTVLLERRCMRYQLAAPQTVHAIVSCTDA